MQNGVPRLGRLQRAVLHVCVALSLAPRRRAGDSRSSTRADAGCGCNFCAFCLKDCGGGVARGQKQIVRSGSDDVHKHIRSCKYAKGHFSNDGRAQKTVWNKVRKERIKDCLNEMCDTKDQMETVLKNLKVQFDGLGLTITAADLNTAAPKKKKKKPADADALERRGWTALHYELRARSLPDRGTTRDLAERLAAALAAPLPSDEALEVPAATPTSLAEEESSDNTCVNQGTEQQTWFIPVSKSTLHVVEFDTAVDGAAAESAAEGADKPSEPPAAETPPEPSAAAQTSDADPAGEVTCVIEEWPDGTEEQTWHIPVSTEEAARAARNLRAASAAATASSLLRAGAKRAKTRRASAIGTHLARFPDPEAEKADFEKLVSWDVDACNNSVIDIKKKTLDQVVENYNAFIQQQQT